MQASSFNDGLPAGYAATLIGIFLILVVGILAAGLFAYDRLRNQSDADARRHLESIAERKAEELGQWRRERLADARVIASNAFATAALERLFQGSPNSGDERALRTWMESLCVEYGYVGAVAASAPGERLITVSTQEIEEDEHYRNLGVETAASGTARLTPLHQAAPGGPVFFEVAVALAASTGDAIGSFLLVMRAEDYLYPLIRSWTTPTETGETMLVRHEAGRAVFLSQPSRSREDAFESPVAPGPFGAALRETAEDSTVHFSEVDYRGARVLAASRPVRDSAWMVIAKIDESEVHAPLKRQALLLALAVTVLIFGSAAGVALLWRRMAQSFAAQQRQSVMEREALSGHYDYLKRFGNDIILLTDERGKLIEVNDRATMTYGYTRDELLGKNLAELNAPGSSADFSWQWKSTEEMGSLLFETEHQRKDGSSLAVEASVRAIDIEGRKFRQCIMRDITARKQSEKQIRRVSRLYAVLSRCNEAAIHAQSEGELFQRICDVAVETGEFSLAWIGLVDAESRRVKPAARAGPGADYLGDVVISVNDEMFGEGPAGVAFREKRSVVSNDILTDPAMAPWREKAAARGFRSKISVPVLRNGEAAGILGLFSPEAGFFDHEEIDLIEDVAANIAYTMDRLEQERRREEAEAALRQSEERYRKLIESAPVGIVLEQQGRVLYLNEQGARLLRFESADDVTGRRLEEFIHPEHRDAIVAVVEEVEPQRETIAPTEVICLRRDGTSFPVEYSAVPIVYDGETAGLAFFTDISGKKKAEEERARMEEQFLQAQKMESVGRLAGGVAHDFNNHLTVINGYCDLLLPEYPEGDPVREQLDQIRRAGEQAAYLTRQLLAFSRKQVVDPRPLLLDDVLKELEKMLQRLIGENITLTVRKQATDEAVVIDRGQIQQVIMNLIVNARDAMPSGGAILVETEAVELDQDAAPAHTDAQPGRYVVLRVSDTGAGMEKAVQDHIFEPFFTTKKPGRGTGLGLSSAYGIVRQSGGFISVESAPGRGAKIEVYLPAAKEPPERPAVQRDRAPESSGSAVILVVEDQKELRAMAVAILQRHGYQILSAADGAEALAVSEQHEGEIDLLITDVVMPGMPGPQLASQLARLRPAMKVLYISGYATEELGSDGVLEKGVAYLAKPFSPDALLRKAQEVLEPSKQLRTILIVDDEEPVRAVLRQALAQHGYRVCEAPHGKAAMRVLAESPADVVILDLVMPEQEGIETLTQIRRDYPEVKVVAISGAFAGGFLGAARKLGADATLSKPIDPKDLMETLQQVLKHSSPE